MPNAIFIDTSNLNTLFKVNDKFVLGVNYNSCPEKIAVDAQALGASFDVYLSVWPRQRGESEDCVNSLSVGGVPFVALGEEIEAVLKLVDKVPGVGTIYICNALANFVIQSRVSNFQSVINYGNRVALVTVRNKMLEDLRIFDTPDDLYAECGEDFSCYGDMDLIDVDAIKAQYEELTQFNRNIIVPLAHLITSYRSPYNVDAETVKQEMYLGEYADQRRAEAPPPPPTPEPKKREPIKPRYTDEDAQVVQYVKPKVSLLNVVLILVILAGAAIVGLGFSFEKTVSEVSQMQSTIAPYQVEASRYNSLANVYTSSGNMAKFASDLLRYAQLNNAGFTISGMEVSSSSVVVRCNTTLTDGIETFRTYLEAGYIVGEVNILDQTQGAGGAIIYNYNVTVVRQ